VCGAHGTALTSCRLRRGREHLSAFSMQCMQCTWNSTYKLLVEEGKGAFVSIQHTGAALTRCRLRRGREHLSAFSVRCAQGCRQTYILSVEEGKGALSAFSVRCAWGSTYKLSVEEGSICQHSVCGAHGAALTACRLRRAREHLSAFSIRGQHLHAVG
jgi:hypothetical protein